MWICKKCKSTDFQLITTEIEDIKFNKDEIIIYTDSMFNSKKNKTVICKHCNNQGNKISDIAEWKE